MTNTPTGRVPRIDPDAVRTLDFHTLTRANARRQLLALCRGDVPALPPNQTDRMLMLAAEAALLCARRRARRRDIACSLRQTRRRYAP